MASAATIERPGTSIVAMVEANPVMVLTDREKFNRFYEEIKRQCDAHEPDLSTVKGRKAIASLANDVAKTKVAIDDAGKKLNEEARLRINAVDEARREIRQTLDALKIEVRRPLTEWEEAEDARVAECQRVIGVLRQAAVIGYEETAAEVRARHTEIEAMTFEPLAFDGYMPQVEALRYTALTALLAAAERMEKEEADRAELERLRAAAAESEAKEAAEREERERAERERLAAEEAERQRIAAEEAEAQRIRDAEERAANAAREEEARRAREAEQERERAHAAALAEERHQREEAEGIARDEQQRREREEAEVARLAEENRKLEANKAHRNRVKTAAKDALITCGADEDTARKIVLAMIAGEIPAVSINFGSDRT